MGEQIIELYSDAEVSKLRRRLRRWSAALCVIAAAGLAACVILLALTRTANARQMEPAVIAVSTLAGWVAIYIGAFVVRVRRRELNHAAMLRGGERTRLCGTASVTEERVAIYRSITARRVELCSGGETHRLLVSETRAGELAAAGAMALYTVHGFVAAYEVTQ